MTKATATVTALPATRLPRPAERLLDALAASGARAVPDPDRAGSMVVRSASRGVSLSGSRHGEDAAGPLVSAGLAEWECHPVGRRALCLTSAGRGFLRRQAASDRADAFRAQHAELREQTVTTDEGTSRAVVNACESPLAWLRSRRDRDGEPMIDAASFEAGERLRRDLTTGGLLPSVTARWDGAVGGGKGGFDPAAATDAAIAARQRVGHALKAVGTDFAGLLVDLCGFLKGLESIERERRWPARSAKVVVRLALGRLAEHYGLRAEARGPAWPTGTRVWLADEAPLA